MSTMPTIPQPMMYQYHPTINNKGSFGPVLAVLSVISFLALVACLVSRFCTRKISRSKLDTLDQHYYDSESDLEKGDKGFGIDFDMVKPHNHNEISQSRKGDFMMVKPRNEISQNGKGDFEIKFSAVKSNMKKDPRGAMRPYGGNNVIHPDMKNNVNYEGNNVIHPGMKNNVNYGRGNNVAHHDLKSNVACGESGGRRFQGNNMM